MPHQCTVHKPAWLVTGLMCSGMAGLWQGYHLESLVAASSSVTVVVSHVKVEGSS